MTNVFNYSDIVCQILTYLPDIRYLLTVSRTVYDNIIKSEDYTFWSQHILSDKSVMGYGMPKMLQLVNDIKGSMIYASCNLNMLKHLKDLEVDINTNQMLISASENGHLQVVEYLLSIGANIHARDDYAVRWASRNGHLKVVEYLVSVGADIHSDNDCTTRWASHNGHLEVVQYLVSVGANIHAIDDCAVRWASSNGHFEVVEYLVSVGADIHADNDYAIRWARAHKHLEIVKYLSSLN
jgi:ankyrin repeat protein